MNTALAMLCLILAIGVMGYFKARQERKAGAAAVKLKQAQEALRSVEKTNDAYSRLDADQRKQLLKRYGRSQ